MTNTAKRLDPLGPTLAMLFLLSGNECAYRDATLNCKERIFDENYVKIGQVCHIAAASEGGERFDSSMTNEERRSFGNLLLLCYKHHVATDDVTVWPTDRMRELKTSHEAQFLSAAAELMPGLTDLRSQRKITPATSADAFIAYMNWDQTLGRIERETTMNDLNELASRLISLTDRALGILSILLREGTLKEKIGTYGSDHIYIRGLYVLAGHTNMNQRDLIETGEELSNVGLGYSDPDGSFEYNHTGSYIAADCDIEGLSWKDIANYLRAMNIPTDRILRDLRFDLFDKPPAGI